MTTPTTLAPATPPKVPLKGWPKARHLIVEWWRRCCAVGNFAARQAYRVVEGGIILGMFVVAIYAGWWIVFGDQTSPRYSRMMALIPIISAHWKALLALLIPLFFRTVRTFVDEVQEFGGAKRKSSLPGPGTEAKNLPGPSPQ